ncbi:MAG: helix-turn-helix domain-containing protein [Streptosporangiaceae bacterium]
MTNEAIVPEWDLGWRLRRSMAHAGLTTEEMAQELGVSRSTVSGWLNTRGAQPRIGYLKVWALRCGVPLEWLISGDRIRTPGSFPALRRVA